MDLLQPCHQHHLKHLNKPARARAILKIDFLSPKLSRIVAQIQYAHQDQAECVGLIELSADRPMGLFDQCIVSTLLYLLLDFIRVLMSTESYQR